MVQPTHRRRVRVGIPCESAASARHHGVGGEQYFGFLDIVWQRFDQSLCAGGVESVEHNATFGSHEGQRKASGVGRAGSLCRDLSDFTRTGAGQGCHGN